MTAAASKLVSMREAIAAHVPSGATVMMGGALEQMIPFSAGHEIIRQGRRDLTLVGPISDMLFDQMIGAGCVARVMAAWVGNASVGLGYCFRRAVEHAIPNPIEVVDYTNFTIAMALHAGALGVPFLPTYAALGSDVLKGNGNLREFTSPVGGERLVAVRALHPDAAIVQVQRADESGNSHLWGNLGVVVDAARAARKVIVVAEEIVAGSDLVRPESHAHSGIHGDGGGARAVGRASCAGAGLLWPRSRFLCRVPRAVAPTGGF
jgi:glutaconate CoA-transferase subunit A